MRSACTALGFLCYESVRISNKLLERNHPSQNENAHHNPIIRNGLNFIMVEALKS